MSGSSSPERVLLLAATALVTDPHQSVARADVLTRVMADVLERIDRTASTEMTAIAFAAEDMIAALASGPTWEARRRLQRAVHSHFMRRAGEAVPPRGVGQEERAGA